MCCPQFPLAAPFPPHYKHSSALSLSANHNSYLNLKKSHKLKVSQRRTLFYSPQLPFEPHRNGTFLAYLPFEPQCKPELCPTQIIPLSPALGLLSVIQKARGNLSSSWKSTTDRASLLSEVYSERTTSNRYKLQVAKVLLDTSNYFSQGG